MWKLSTTIKGVRAQPQTVLRVTGLKGRKAHPGKSNQVRDADHARTPAHNPSAQKPDLIARLRSALDRHPNKPDAAPKPGRHAPKPDTVHRWHIPSHVVRHKIKSRSANANSRLRAAPDRHPHKQDAASKAPQHAAKPGTVLRWHIPSHAVRHKIKPAPQAVTANSRLRATLDRHSQKQNAASKAPRHAAKKDSVLRWHIPSHAVRHKMKSAQHAVVRAPQPRGARPLAPAPARHPHRPDLPERITARPGDVLREEFLKPLGLSVNGLAMELCVPANRIGAIIKGERSVTADTALRLGRYFRTSPEFWLNLQSMHDLTRAHLEWGHLIEYSVRPRR